MTNSKSRALRKPKTIETVTRSRAPRVDHDGIARYLAQQPEIVLAYLFGSVARGQGDHFSDVDVAVLFDDHINAERRGELRLDYMLALTAYADRDVDVINLANATPVLKMQVLREGRLLYARNELARITFEVGAAKLYYDTQPLRDFQNAYLRRELKRRLNGYR